MYILYMYIYISLYIYTYLYILYIYGKPKAINPNISIHVQGGKDHLRRRHWVYHGLSH